MWAETFGPPGVGKSYLQRAAFRSIQSEHPRICREPTEEEFAPYVGLSNDVKALHEAHSISNKRRKAGPRVFTKRLRYVAVAKEMEQMVFFNEALFQSAIAYSLAVNHDMELLQELVDMLPLPDLAIACLAPPQVILDRNRIRALEGGVDRSPNTLDTIPATKLIADTMVRKGVNCITVDTSAPIGETVKLVKERFQQCLR